jgi:hypothetical protein
MLDRSAGSEFRMVSFSAVARARSTRALGFQIMSMKFVELHSYFRDDDQRQAVQDIVQTRLADDRNQEECRYLMRFWWQLSMSYQEVTPGELQKYVSSEKLSVLGNLLHSLECGHGEIDTWIEKYSKLPIIEDQGFQRQ